MIAWYWHITLLAAAQALAIDGAQIAGLEKRSEPSLSGGKVNAPLAWTSRIGGPHGERSWSDGAVNAQNPVLRLKGVKMWCGDRLDAIAFSYAERTTGPDTRTIVEWSGPYGRARGTPSVEFELQLKTEVQYITKVEGVNAKASRGAASDHTRIGHLQFTTSDGRVYGCGASNIHDANKITWSFPGKALAFTNGNYGSEVDQITGAWVDLDDY